MKGVAMSSERLLPRRSIIKGGAVLGAALAAAAAGFGPVRALADEGEIEVIATHDEAGEIEVIATRADSAAIEDTQYGFIVNTARCVNCGECVQACHTYNGLPEGTTGRRRITPYESSFGKRVYVSTSCMHCENPSCRDVCPAGAIEKRADGIVVVHQERCIGCKYCYQACPFGVPQYSTEGMDKCDCCLGCGVPASEEPHCVQACMFDALKYGKLEDLERKSHGAAQRLEASTDPSFLLA